MESTKPTIGLALGGGVARGWSHIGVLKELHRLGIEPDVICGTSVGALVGAAYLTGHLDVLEKWSRALTQRRMLGYLDIKLGSGGILGGERLAKLMRDYFDEIQIETLGKPFVTVCTELATGHEIWLRKGNVVDAIRASYALPGVFGPVKIENRWLIDGALVNPVPTSVCRALGARLVIGVSLNADSFGKSSTLNQRQLDDIDHPPDDFLKQVTARKASLRPDRLLMRQLFGTSHGAPGLTTVMLASLNIVMDRLSRSRMAGDPADVLIAPQVGHIGLLDFDRAAEAIALGEEAVIHQLGHLQEALTILA